MRAQEDGLGTPARIALIVDSPTRDIGGMTLLGVELARRGAQVLLVPMNLRERELSALDPDLVVLNYLRRPNQDFVRRLRAAGVQLGLLDTEGGIGIIGPYGAVHDHYGNVMADDRSVRDSLAFVCAWGPLVAAHMVHKRWYRADQVIITGSPRFDWYHPSLREAALEASPNHLKGPVVLVVGSFPAANGLRPPEQEIAMRQRVTGYTREALEQTRALDTKAMEATIDLVRELAAAHTDTQFVYRPHPFERVETYHERFREFPNVRVIRKGTADGWVLRCVAAIVPNDCTIAVECVMADVPALITAWIVPEHQVEAVTKAGHMFSEPAELGLALSDILSGSFSGPNVGQQAHIDEVISDWFHRADGQSYRRVADVVMSCLQRRPRSMAKRRRIHHVRAGVAPWSRGGLQDRIKAALRLPARFSFRRLRVLRALRWDSGPKAYTVADVEPALEALNTSGICGDLHVIARPASRRDYAFRYDGRSVILETSSESVQPSDSSRQPVEAGHT